MMGFFTTSPVSQKRFHRPPIVLGCIPVYSAIVVSLRPDSSDILSLLQRCVDASVLGVTCLEVRLSFKVLTPPYECIVSL